MFQFLRHCAKAITILLLLISVYFILLLKQNVHSVTYYNPAHDDPNTRNHGNAVERPHAPFDRTAERRVESPLNTAAQDPAAQGPVTPAEKVVQTPPRKPYSDVSDTNLTNKDEDEEETAQFEIATPPVEQVEQYFGNQIEEDKKKFKEGAIRPQPRLDSQPVRKFVPFGNTANFACDTGFCYINGRTIKRELIVENPEDMFTVLPPEDQFLKEFRNPCWKGPDLLGETKLYCLPYFYIIGFTKCGTTDLFGILKNHTLVSSRAGKETHYFDRSRRGRIIRMNRRPERLPVSFMSFSNAGRFRLNLLSTYKKIENSDTLFHGITMDATPSQVWDNEFWEVFHPGYREPPVTNADVIHTLTPKAKIIVSLRDPIKRMQSAYQFFCAYHVYKCDYPVTNRKFHLLVKHAVEIFNRCLSTNSIRGCVYSTNTHQLATHLYASIYSVYLKDWFAIFPRDQIYVMKFEEHIVDELSNINHICDFLDIPRFPQEEMKEYLSEHTVRNSLSDEKKIPYILPETMDILKDFFRPFNRELVEMLGDEKWTWGYD